ncbi:MAG: VWA domain-containing protein, partial [Planctomycetia bacterium]|nr:VWA domain-containing protein [Planctomycetia bacterium]
MSSTVSGGSTPRAAPAASSAPARASGNLLATVIPENTADKARSAGRTELGRSLAVAGKRQITHSTIPESQWGFAAGGRAEEADDMALGVRLLEMPPRPQPGRETYAAISENPLRDPLAEPLSTFSVDVDTASYANVRRFLTSGRRPPRNAVRVEELINYFSYDDPAPTGGDPFAVSLEAAASPWHADRLVVRIGLKARDIDRLERPAGNLVFLVDVSGSMSAANKLPLVKQSLKLLVNELGASDRISLVTYAGQAALRLPPTSGDEKATILAAIDGLASGGSTHGSAGIEMAYAQAAEHFVEGGVNRVLLATDGDLNVGITSDAALEALIREKAQSGVFLTVLGFGEGNLQDAKMERIADKGNGLYAYIDGLREARKVLVEQLTGSTITVAKDVKLQVEFNPATVAGYRLIGYENRLLAAEDFRDDTKDAGEIGAGHSVTAL